MRTADRAPLLRCQLLLVVTVLFSLGANRPNVVLVMTDDQGYGDLSCHGNPLLKTPAIDSLAADAVRLTDYHVSPTCSPTRSALLTGHWTNRTGVWHTIMGRSLLRENEVTLGTLFQRAGYATGMFGKWHLGDNYPCRPEDRGFGEVLRLGGGGVGQTPDYWDNAYFDGHYWHNGEPIPVEGFCTDVFFDYAKRFIRQQKEAGTPFLAYIATNAPHGPMHAPSDKSQPFDALGVHVSNFFGMIANIDDNVGQLRAFLREEGLEDNTIFVFTTDNGTSSGAKVFNAGMRGTKGSEYDGGHRVPFFIHWPAGQMKGGRDVSSIAAHVDVVPTLLDLCGIAPPTDIAFDGVSLKPLLDPESAQRIRWKDRILVTDSQRVKDPIKWRKSAVMTGQWRLINGRELYDMRRDPGQKSDVAEENPEVVQRLRQFYEGWWAELEPTFQDDVALYVGHPDESPTRLTAHDWITTANAPWNQRQIRNALTGAQNTGFWNVQVHKSGKYEVRLRRWPQEIDATIDASIPAGADVPGELAIRAVPGKAIHPVRATLTIGDKTWEEPIAAGAKEAVFHVELMAGRTQLSGQFVADAATWYGAYYAYVTRLDSTTN
ncbi:MAG: arylsulfatase [Planctomycetales bacterium]|nr:arylsulfatase [Planctomycetales bacterium]